VPCEGMVHITVISAVMEFQGGTIPIISPTGQVVHLCMVACYTLNGNVNSYSNKYLYSKNLHTVHYVPMNDLQVRVCCAMSVHKIKVLMFTKRTINSYIWLILTKLLTELQEERKQLLHAQKCDSPFNKFSATVMEKAFGKYVTDTL